MAPYTENTGYWGPVTSTIDWCEDNYQVLPQPLECSWKYLCREQYYAFLKDIFCSPLHRIQLKGVPPPSVNKDMIKVWK